MKNPKDIVREGYDRVSYAYRPDDPKSGEQGYGAEAHNHEEYRSWIGEFTSRIDPGTAVLDLGCGCGVPTAQLLADRYTVTGCDISPVQIERARKLVPNATFEFADMCELTFDEGTFSGIVALYSIIHVPIEEQPALLRSMNNWLIPGGYLLLTAGHRAWTGTDENWLGVKDGQMYWSLAYAETYIEWLGEAGYEVTWSRFIPEENSGHTLVLAQA